MQTKLTLLQRWSGPTSEFFKPVVKYGYLIMAIAAGIAVFHQELTASGLPVPALVTKIAEIAAWVSGAIATISKLTVADPKAYLEEISKQNALKDL